MGNVLIACENSAEVRNAFMNRGHNAVSVDLLESDDRFPHIQDDIINYLHPIYNWDMMIAFPPCTYLCVSGIHWNRKRPERAILTESSIQFVQTLLSSPIPYICIENPIGVLSTRIRPPDQIVQPYWFGDAYRKSTCLWLKGLPKLEPTDMVPIELVDIKKIHYAAPGPDRWKTRSRTPRGLALAMASQWGPLLKGDTHVLAISDK